MKKQSEVISVEALRQAVSPVNLRPASLREVIRIALGQSHTRELEDRLYVSTRLFFRGMTNQLEAPLRRYTMCRHGYVGCFCTVEARAALSNLID